MTGGRHLPPVHSPVSLRGLIRGWVATSGVVDAAAAGRLEGALRDRFAADVVLLTDSGTSALAVAIHAALRARPDAPVALPAYCCYDVVTAAAAANAAVLLYDVDPSTLGPDWPSLRRALAAGAGAVVLAALYGVPVDFDRAASLAGEAGVTVIEDAAQGAGASLRGRRLGSLGAVSVLSFGRGKGMTGGAGGALLARSSGASLLDAAERRLEPATGGARALCAASAQWLLGRPYAYALPAALPFLRLGETVYRAPHPPRRLAPGPAALVLDSLRGVDEEAKSRRATAARLIRGAHAAGWSVPVAPEGAVPGYLRLPLLPPSGPRPAVRALGIARGYPLALADLPELGSRCRNPRDEFPGARRLAATLLTAPTHSLLSEGDALRLEAWMRT